MCVGERHDVLSVCVSLKQSHCPSFCSSNKKCVLKTIQRIKLALEVNGLLTIHCDVNPCARHGKITLKG